MPCMSRCKPPAKCSDRCCQESTIYPQPYNPCPETFSKFVLPSVRSRKNCEMLVRNHPPFRPSLAYIRQTRTILRRYAHKSREPAHSCKRPREHLHGCRAVHFVHRVSALIPCRPHSISMYFVSFLYLYLLWLSVLIPLSLKMKLPFLLPATIFSAFAEAITLITATGSYTVNAGSSNDFEFVVSRTNCDITSLKYRGVETQYKSTGSHISSGLGTGTAVSAQEITSRFKLSIVMARVLIKYSEQVDLPNMSRSHVLLQL